MLSDDYPPERRAVFERMVERTAPPEDLRCYCDLCCYGERPRLTLPAREGAA